MNSVVTAGNRFAYPGPEVSLQIRHGDVLINGTGRGTIGRSAPYLFETPAMPDNHVTILRSDFDPTYLSLYLNSKAGQIQVEMHQRGTSGQVELYPRDIRKFLIWAAPVEFQARIRSLYDQSAEARKDSESLFNKATESVESLIKAAAK